jgi:xanthine dehydrogenase accessory factor
VSELQDVLRAIEDCRVRGEPMALATVVGVRGSTYRREGARYLIPQNGKPVGTISGGCLEGDVRETAAKVMSDGHPQLVHFDLTADDEVVWGWGLGCNGVIDVFVEPADRAAEVAEAMRTAIDEQRRLAVVTVVEDSGDPAVLGARLLLEDSGVVTGTLGHPSLDAEAADRARRALDAERSGLVSVGDGTRAFVEVLVPPIRLLVCGAGHDARPLVRYAADLGWRVEVLDDRETFLKPTRFPEATRLVKADPADAARAAQVDSRTYVVVMSHNFLRDREYLRAFLGSPAPYIGMLGPKARLQRLLDDLRRQGFDPSTEDVSVVHGPAGLDLGSEGPEEVAWSIVGEILALRNGRGGGHLRDQTGFIHDRPGMESQTPASPRATTAGSQAIG